MKTVKCSNCRKYTVLSTTTCVHCGADLSDAIDAQAIEAKIRQIRKAHEPDWLQQPNVVSVAMRRDPKGDYYIEIGVVKSGEAVDIPETIEDVSVRIEQIGRIYTASNPL